MKKHEYGALADAIIKSVGNKENIVSLTHCTTRLRFVLKDEKLADMDKLQSIDGVITVVKSGGQFQVVIGSHVAKVYEEINERVGELAEEKEEIHGIFNKLIDIISGVFQPLLGPLCATGVIKGVTALLLMLKVADATSGTIIVLNALGDALFYFMPILIGYTSAKKFKLNPFTGMVIGAVLCYPTIQGGALAALNEGKPLMVFFEGTIFASSVNATFLGIPMIGITYTSSVIPVIFVTWFASVLQKKFEKFISPTLQSIIVPFLVLLIAIPIGLIVIGPIITYGAAIVSKIFSTLYAFSPLMCGLFIGLFWQVLVIFGIHWGLVPIVLMNIGTLGFDQVLCGTFGATFAQTAVVIALYMKSKNKEFKAVCIPAVISGMFGITEPAIYGITLPRKKPFIFSMIGGGVSGAIIGLFNVKRYAMGGGGLVGIVNFLNPENGDTGGFMIIVIAAVVAMITSFVLTMLFWKDDTGEVVEKKIMLVQGQDILTPVAGKVIPLNETSDAAFAGGLLGKGVTILPEEGVLRSPVDGVAVALYPSKHAIGLESDEGLEVLIHVGMNTVELNGKFFDSKVEQGERVKKGQVLLEFDIAKIKEAGYSVETPVIITNLNESLELVPTIKKMVKQSDTIMEVTSRQAVK